MLFLSKKKRRKVSKTKLSSAPPILKHGVNLRWPNRTFFCDTPRRIPAQGNWSLWPISACFCVLGNFTGQNRLFVVHSGTADAISVQKTEKSVNNEIVLRPPNSKARCPPPLMAQISRHFFTPLFFLQLNPTYMKRILHFKDITFKSSYNWFKIDIHQQLRPLTTNYLAMFKVTSTTRYT